MLRSSSSIELSACCFSEGRPVSRAKSSSVDPRAGAPPLAVPRRAALDAVRPAPSAIFETSAAAAAKLLVLFRRLRKLASAEKTSTLR